MKKVVKIFAIVLALTMLVSSLAVVSAAEAKSYGFENGNGEWTLGSGASISKTQSNAHSGSASLCFKGTNPNSDIRATYITELSAGKVYSVSAYLNIDKITVEEGAGAKLRVVMGSETFETERFISSELGYRKAMLFLNSSETELVPLENNVKIIASLEFKGSGTVYFDDFAIEEVTDLIPNSDFEGLSSDYKPASAFGKNSMTATTAANPYENINLKDNGSYNKDFERKEYDVFTSENDSVTTIVQDPEKGGVLRFGIDKGGDSGSIDFTLIEKAVNWLSEDNIGVDQRYKVTFNYKTVDGGYISFKDGAYTKVNRESRIRLHIDNYTLKYSEDIKDWYYLPYTDGEWASYSLYLNFGAVNTGIKLRSHNAFAAPIYIDSIEIEPVDAVGYVDFYEGENKVTTLPAAGTELKIRCVAWPTCINADSSFNAETNITGGVQYDDTKVWAIIAEYQDTEDGAHRITSVKVEKVTISERELTRKSDGESDMKINGAGPSAFETKITVSDKPNVSYSVLVIDASTGKFLAPGAVIK